MDEIRIGRDGTWYFNGEKMFRMAAVTFLSSHLRFKEDQYYICWQNQEFPVTVEDVPFVINGIFDEGSGLKARLYDERVVDLPEKEVIFRDDIPYISLFDDSLIDTKFSRAAFWQISPYIRGEDGQQWIRYPKLDLENKVLEQ